ncbi:MAG: DUF3866 family protein [Propionibacteriaceae bacterium]
MIIWAEGTVTEIERSWAGAVQIRVDRDSGGDAQAVRALVYTDLMAEPRIGDRVLLNVAALERGLGTGGYALVIAVLDADGRLDAQPPAPAGHLVKARYLPLQAMVAGADEQGSPHHEALASADSVDGLPVLVADLHSAVGPALLTIAHDRPGTRVVYVMSDHGALPIAFSRSVAELREAGLLAATVTTGQAFGGDLEAVNVHSGLLAAKIAAEADLVVVSQGPGNLGTGTRWGFSGVSCGEVVNAAALLGGRPVGSLRISSADQRDRHRGLSHHSITAYGRVALSAADLPVPDLAGTPELVELLGAARVEELAGQVTAGCAELNAAGRHRLVDIDLTGLPQLLADSPVPMSTMGRSYVEDPAYFLGIAAAARHAAGLIDRR